MNIFNEIAKTVPQMSEALGEMKKESGRTLLVGGSEIHKANIIAADSAETQRILVLVPDEGAASQLVDDINAMQENKTAVLYPARDITLRGGQTPSREYEQKRLGILCSLCSEKPMVVVASAEAALQYTMPMEYLKKRRLTITADSVISLDTLKNTLIMAGYEPRETVDGVAQFCVRGGIADIFPPSSESPVRIEFWGDDIDSISSFDIETQRRTQSVDKIEITPANEVLFDSSEEFIFLVENFLKTVKDVKAKEKISADLDKVKSGVSLNSYDKYMGLAYEKSGSLIDYMKGCHVFVSEYVSVREQQKNVEWQQNEDYKQLLEEGELEARLIKFSATLPEFINSIGEAPAMFLDTFARTNRDIGYDKLIAINPVQTGGFSGELKLLVEDQTALLKENYAVILMAGTMKAANSLVQDLQKMGVSAELAISGDPIKYGKITVCEGNISSGFEYPESKISVVTTMAARAAKAQRSRFKKGRQLKNITDLVKGDLVVHAFHGIGVFDGINKLSMQGVTKDYIKLNYSGADVLYVPVTQLDLVSKYIGAKDDGQVKLNKLHSAEWQKTRQRVKQAVADMADELIELYSKRMASKGYAFSPDTEWQKDFEQHFPYTETDDQLRCVEEIKADMEKEQPMDRVLCGDVGFGKTEVAMRACFKAVMDNKQVAVLCPTTILAWQHYQSFLRRFEQFPVNIEVLSRFRSAKEQKEILKKLEKGVVNIIIGTHRLVQKDVIFKDLGLAVIDEEQRFGVKHKERFKEQFTSVDMLTLSATPIPRTLNMAISGIRDMSTIEQAPLDRHPVQSYVLEYDNGIIMDALRRELRRGGQAYYIHNRIESIERCAAKIQSEIPNARIAVAHGRIDEEELSDIWRRLVDREIDILVCTTIIETGVDIANCNTLIIENADRMGLSQLYQLRGRVGRSSRRAFAYFTFTRDKVLSEIAQKRLAAIREFTKFGSGFHIAMRDLEIRGAGSLLGAKQHGHMEAVGYDMYLKMLSEAVALKKGEALPASKTSECLIDLAVDAHIPDDYIQSTANRVDIYKKIADITSEEDRLDVIDELIDRFGDPPPEVLSLTEIAILRNGMAAIGFEEVSDKPNGLFLYPHTLNNPVYAKLTDALKGRMLVNASARPYITVKPKKGEKKDSIRLLKEILEAAGQ